MHSFSGRHSTQASFQLAPLRCVTPLGKRAMSPATLDLLDFAAAIFRVERRITGRQRTDPTARVELTFPVRVPGRWTRRVVETAEGALQLLGNAEWSITAVGGSSVEAPEVPREIAPDCERVALFSGGLDSWCGAAILPKAGTRLVSFYTRQRALQSELAEVLGHQPPVQWGWAASGDSAGRGGTFYYRSFLFLSVAAASAATFGAGRIVQCENGVLASSVPPSPMYRITRHAHPEFARLMEDLFSRVLGHAIAIENPFRLTTKRQAYIAACGNLTGEQAATALKTQTCWSLAAPKQRGGKAKKPWTPCGVCIPCIVRRTALPSGTYARDLTKDAPKNDAVAGRDFRAYYTFLDQVLKLKGGPDEFYFLLDGAARQLLISSGHYTKDEIYKLFRKFATEFMGTYL
jgi:7-cyano-7-deazaguanine synthase in queuosine biosynthesis